MKNRAISLLLVIVLLVSCFPLTSFSVSASEDYTEPTIIVESKYTAADTQLDVNVNIKNNPGIAGATLRFTYDSDLTLIKAENGEAFSDLTLTVPGKFTNPSDFLWDSVTGQVSNDGTILTLTFQVSADAADNDNLNIEVSYYPGDIYNEKMDSLNIQTVNGCITVIDYVPGDVNSDNQITGKDVTLVRRHIVGGYDQDINVSAADVNEDGRINGKDVTLIRRFIVGDDVELKPSKPKCNHSMIATPYKAATCTVDGNIAYWHCSTCDKYFSDEEGETEISLDNIVILSTGHTEVIDSAVAPTYTSTGLTEGSHCSTCNAVLREQQVIPMLDKNEYSITYHIANNDNYLKQQNIENKNENSYYSEEGLVLKDLIVDGYNFKGWYTAQTGGTKVTEIKKGDTGNKVLYAQWEKVEYTVTFDSPDVPWDSVTYTVDKGTTLTKPEWFGYTFVGWSLDGEIVSIIPPGTTGNITLHANWTSDRNKAKSVGNLAAPDIIEDMDNGQYLFVYELGTIENVPLSEIEYLGNSQGINISKEYEYSKKIGEGYADTIAKAVSNATTRTSAWTLSEDWNKTTSATNEHDEEIGKTESKTDSEGVVTGSKYYISNSAGGSTSSSSSGGGSNSSSAKVTESTSAGINGSYTREQESSSSVKLSTESSVSAGVKAEYMGVEASVNAEISAGEEQETSKKDKQSATIANSRERSAGTEDINTSESHWDTSSSSSSNWNTTSSYENSATTSQNTEISKAISQIISDRYSYTSTNSIGGSNSNTQSTGESQELTDEYASTIEYSIEETEKVTTTITKKSDATGYYRLVSAGTVHVFGVVGYDLATNSYYTYTYNVLDKERHEYLDYSKDNANFNDCENAILPFEVPYFVHEYISTKIARTPGLTVDTDTGIITEYSNDSESENVIIPEYVSVKNGNGTYSAIKIRGISSDAFKGNTRIKGVYLPKYVYEIPKKAFEGCTSLETVMGYGISEIRENAFKDCTSLKSFTVDDKIEVLENNAFLNTPELVVTAINENVANGAINSGAKKISLDISMMKESFDNRKITIADSTDYFALMSNDSTYKNLQIESNAKETLISNIGFTNNIDTPLKLNSEIVTLSKVTVEKSPGFALILANDNTELKLFGTINLSTLGENAVISKNVALVKADPEVAGKIKLTGNYLVNGEISNSKMLEFVTGEIIVISDADYDTYLTSCTILFDANDGTVTNDLKIVYYGQAYGDLPVPTREHYVFDGWYTTNGTKITADTIVTSLVNQTLYAKWSPKEFTVTFNANEGSVSTNSKTVAYNSKYGELPVPEREYYTFLGWYTKAEGGEKITAETVATTSEDLALFAQWEQNSVSEWVLASNVPEGAEIVDTKYSYDLTSYTTSGSSSMNGWTLYNTTWAWGNYGSWSGWSKSAVYSSDSRQVETKTVTDRAGYTNYKYWIYRTSDGWGYGTQNYYTGSSHGSCTIYDEININYSLPVYNSSLGTYGPYNSSKFSHSGDSYWFSGGSSWVPAVTHTEYRYRDRSKVYTYYFTKTDSLETTSDPTGQSNVSNVVKWVQYRAK